MNEVSNVSTKRKSKQACGRCGKDPAAGFATVDGVRYCHGDFDPDPTCYMLASRVGYYTGVDNEPPFNLSEELGGF